MNSTSKGFILSTQTIEDTLYPTLANIVLTLLPSIQVKSKNLKASIQGYKAEVSHFHLESKILFATYIYLHTFTQLTLTPLSLTVCWPTIIRKGLE
jgi:hypothetical protein